jgi:hypothetical protein
MTRTHSHRYPHRTSTPLNTLQIKLYQRSLTATTPTYHEGYGRSHRPHPRPQHQLGIQILAPPQDPEIVRLQLLAQQLPTVMHQNDVTAHRHHKGQNSLGHPSGPTPYTTHAHPALSLPTETTSNNNPNEQQADLDHLRHHQSEMLSHKHDEKPHFLPHLRHHQRSKLTYPATASPILAANRANSTTFINSSTTGVSAGTSLQSTPLTKS